MTSNDAFTVLIAFFAALGIGSIIAAIISRWNAISLLRQDWINSLRNEISSFFHAVDVFGATLGNYRKGETEYDVVRQTRDEAMSKYRQVVLRLNFRESAHRILDARLLAVMKVENDRISEQSVLAALIQSRRILKDEWERTKYGPFTQLSKWWKRRIRNARFRMFASKRVKLLSKRIAGRNKIEISERPS